MQIVATNPPAAPRSAAASSAPATTGSGTSGTSTQPAQQVDYMKLIVAQMQNLNPMDPSSGGDGMATMMQAESLNQLTTLNSALKTLQTLTQTGYAASLMGKQVSGVDDTSAQVSGTVIGIHMDSSGPMLDISGGKQLSLLRVTDVGSAAASTAA